MLFFVNGSSAGARLSYRGLGVAACLFEIACLQTASSALSHCCRHCCLRCRCPGAGQLLQWLCYEVAGSCFITCAVAFRWLQLIYATPARDVLRPLSSAVCWTVASVMAMCRRFWDFNCGLCCLTVVHFFSFVICIGYNLICLSLFV